MSNLTDREKQELSEAIDKITDLCSDGLSPNDAIIKTAQDMHLGADRLPILVSAYNIGATADQWHSGESIREKTASFQIADIDAIKRKLYPTSVKTASYQQKMSAYTDNSFSFSPDTLMDDPLSCYRPQPLGSIKKASKLPKEDKIYPGIREVSARLEKKANETSIRSMVYLENCMSKLASIVSDKRAQEYAVFKTAAKVMLGSRGVSIMNSLEEMYPSVKKAKYNPSRASIHRSSPFFEAIQNVSDAIDVVGIAKEAQYDALTKVASAREQVESHWRRAIHGTEVQQLFLDPIRVQALDEADRKAMRSKKADSSLDRDRNMSRLESLNNPDWVGVTNREYGILSALNDAKHKARIRNIVTESMLTDLINTDPVLRKYDPEAVIDAYNDVLEVAPHMVGKRMLLREALREYLSSESLDLGTLGQITQMEDRWSTAKETKQKNRQDSAVKITALMDRRKEERPISATSGTANKKTPSSSAPKSRSTKRDGRSSNERSKPEQRERRDDRNGGSPAGGKGSGSGGGGGTPVSSRQVRRSQHGIGGTSVFTTGYGSPGSTVVSTTTGVQGFGPTTSVPSTVEVGEIDTSFPAGNIEVAGIHGGDLDDLLNVATT